MEALTAINALAFLVLSITQPRRNLGEAFFKVMWTALLIINLFFVLKLSGYIVKDH